MPPAKKSTRTAKKTAVRKTAPAKKTAKRTTKKRAAAKRSGPRKMSASHKKALADGRQASAVVDRYLSALHTPKQRGRKVSPETLRQRLAAAEANVKAETGVARLTAAQEARDLRSRLASAASAGAQDLKSIEADFVKIAKTFGEKRGISYGSWRDAGVPAEVLKRAKVARTRG